MKFRRCCAQAGLCGLMALGATCHPVVHAASGSASAAQPRVEVSGSVKLTRKGQTVNLVPRQASDNFALNVIGGTEYRLDLSDGPKVEGRRWHLAVSQFGTTAGQNWDVKFWGDGWNEQACGSLVFSTPGPDQFLCQGVRVNLSADRRNLGFEFDGTALSADGQPSGQASGKLNITFPVPLRLALYKDFPSRSGAQLSVAGKPYEVVDIHVQHGSPTAPDEDFVIVTPLSTVVPGPALSISAHAVQWGEPVGDELVTFNCGRRLTAEELRCLDSIRLDCDRSFLAEARRCKSVQFSAPLAGNINASVNENLIDHMDAPNPQVRHVSATVFLAKASSGEISGGTSARSINCNAGCSATRYVVTEFGDIAEKITVASPGDAGAGLTVNRSLTDPTRVTLGFLTDKSGLYMGDTRDGGLGSKVAPDAVQFDDARQSITLNGVRLIDPATKDSVVLSGRVQVFGR